MKTSKQRIQRSTAALGTALALGLLALSSVFTKSVLSNEVLIDTVGVAAFSLAVFASIMLYPLRDKVGLRIYCAFTILLAVVLGFEFVGGALFLAADKIIRYEQHK